MTTSNPADPRKNLQPTCGPFPTNPALAQGERSAFFEGLGKAGDLEVLNNIDNSIGQGLRDLETVSNQIRTGLGVPEVFDPISNSIDQGADTVMGALGFDPNTVRTTVQSFSPSVANRATGQAEVIYDRVTQGNFELSDVPGALQDFGNLAQLTRSIFQPVGANESTKIKEMCDPSPYARDLIALAPKNKFMFVVEFVFTAPYQNAFNALDFAFVIKRSTRPNINFEYEDINYYNFRTKVLKKSEYQPMNMTFYDDIRDNVLQFYNGYLRAISPVSTIETVGGGNNQFFEEAGMTFAAEGPNSASSRNVDGGDATVRTIIDYVQLFHIIEGGKFVDVYRFDNPKIVEMQLDELDMADSGAGSEMTLGFHYDALAIQPRIDIATLATRIGNLTDGGVFPIKPNQSGDATPKSSDSYVAGALGEGTAAAATSPNEFAPDLSTITGAGAAANTAAAAEAAVNIAQDNVPFSSPEGLQPPSLPNFGG